MRRVMRRCGGRGGEIERQKMMGDRQRSGSGGTGALMDRLMIPVGGRTRGRGANAEPNLDSAVTTTSALRAGRVGHPRRPGGRTPVSARQHRSSSAVGRTRCHWVVYVRHAARGNLVIRVGDCDRPRRRGGHVFRLGALSPLWRYDVAASSLPGSLLLPLPPFPAPPPSPQYDIVNESCITQLRRHRYDHLPLWRLGG